MCSRPLPCQPYAEACAAACAAVLVSARPWLHEPHSSFLAVLLLPSMTCCRNKDSPTNCSCAVGVVKALLGYHCALHCALSPGPCSLQMQDIKIVVRRLAHSEGPMQLIKPDHSALAFYTDSANINLSDVQIWTGRRQKGRFVVTGLRGCRCMAKCAQGCQR